MIYNYLSIIMASSNFFWLHPFSERIIIAIIFLQETGIESPFQTRTYFGYGIQIIDKYLVQAQDFI